MPVFEFSQCAGDIIGYCWESFVFLTDYRFDFCSVCLVYQACKLPCHRCNVLSCTGLILLNDAKFWVIERGLFSFSLHALKDESYIRQTLQRQAAALHHAAVSYAVSVGESVMHKRSYLQRFINDFDWEKNLYCNLFVLVYISNFSQYYKFNKDYRYINWYNSCKFNFLQNENDGNISSKKIP